MNKARINEARQKLLGLSQKLRGLGVTKLAYYEDHISSMTPATLRSCIAWAEGLVEHFNAVR